VKLLGDHDPLWNLTWKTHIHHPATPTIAVRTISGIISTLTDIGVPSSVDVVPHEM